MEQELGLDKKPGDSHYRAYVGPSRDYDFIAAMCFNLLTCLGLRQSNSVLDIGCGSLRLGRILIPFLNQKKYCGVEPNEWLIKKGIEMELGNDILEIKTPIFSSDTSLKDLDKTIKFDFIIAQSIFSHAGLNIIEDWIVDTLDHVHSDSIFLSTFLESDEDYKGNDWVYPGCVKFTRETIIALAKSYGYKTIFLDWFHPRQRWIAWVKEENENPLLYHESIHWNNLKSVWK